MFELEPFDELDAAGAVDAVRRIAAFLNEENARGPAVAASLLERPPAEWWPYARTIRSELSFGALTCLLDVAQDELDREPLRAYRLSTIIVRAARTMDIPRSSPYGALLRGRAWKVRGHALRSTGRFRAACNAATRAIAILSADGSMVVDRVAALVLRAMILHDLGKTAEAVTLLRECGAAFQRFGEDGRALQVAIIEAAYIYAAGDVHGARSAFLVARAAAERLGDQRELARILNNLGQCEARLGNHEQALVHLRSAQQGFEKVGMTAERQRVFWITARILRDTGRLNDAVAQLLRVRHELLDRGMTVQAALAGLDLLELLAATEPDGRELVAVATELVAIFNAAGMQRNARIALAYLAEQTKIYADPAAFQADLRRVRKYLREFETAPDTPFVLPAPH